jgi:hypothetical protein
MNKIALLFSGQLRGFAYSYPTIQKYFESIFYGYDINYVFNILKENYTIETIIPKNKITALKIWDRDPIEDIHSFCIPNGIGGFSQYHSAMNNNVAHDTKFKHFMLQWYFVKHTRILIEDTYDQYDFIVRIRPDLFFFKPIIDLDLSSLDHDTIIVPKKFDFGGICDRLAIGRPKAMKSYFNFYDECNTIPGNSETRLQTYLQKNKINIITYDIEFCHINQNKQFTYCNPL